MEKLDGETFNIMDENISKLKEIFPEVFNGENQIDFDYLREVLEENMDVVDDTEEHYKFTWWGKKNARRVAKTPTTKTLRPVLKDSKKWNSTQHIYIEGDNLDALKILLDSYHDSVKMIYIDPPYNTGNDFVYNDNFASSKKQYLEDTDQYNEDGFLVENPKTDGMYHSNWLNMIYPRLILARKLLTSDGVIFISIDDNEVHNLKKVCDEIFGEQNFIADITWHKKTQPSFLSKEVSNVKESILFYKKNVNKIVTKGGLTDSNKRIEMINISNNVQFRTLNKENVLLKDEKYSGTLEKGTYGTGNLVIELLNDIEIINGKSNVDLQLKGRFKWSQEKMNDSFAEGDIYHIKNLKSLRPTVEKKNKEVNVKPTLDLLSKKLNDNIPTNTDATNELKKLFDNVSPMDYPKPSDLIKYLVDCVTFEDKDAIILDFFSGSATTLHGVMKLNLEDNGNRKCILVQIRQKTKEKSEAYKAGFENIADLGKERIRRAGDNLIEESGQTDLDIGFKVFKVDESNFIPWNDKIKKEVNKDNVKQAILATANNLVDGRSELDFIYELLLKRLNMDLNSSIEERIVNNHKIYVIENGYALVCLDSNLDESITNDLLELKEELLTDYCKVILRDDAFNGNDKLSINIYETLKSNDVNFETI